MDRFDRQIITLMLDAALAFANRPLPCEHKQDHCRICAQNFEHAAIASALRAEHARGQKAVDAAKAVLGAYVDAPVGLFWREMRAAIREWEAGNE